MLPYERQSQVMELFQHKTLVSPEDIMKRFGVSIATARRDLSHLEEKQLVKKVYGGAVLTSNAGEDIPMKERMSLHQERKSAIGRYCAELVRDGDFIFLDYGTTPLYVARHLKKRKNVTVITNSVLVINELIDTDASIIVLGGQLRKEELSLAGISTVSALDEYQLAWSFLSVGGLSTDYGITDYHPDEIEVKKKAISRSRQTAFLADSSKFDNVSPRYICALDAVDLVVSDWSLAPDTAAAFRAAGCKLILADQSYAK